MCMLIALLVAPALAGTIEAWVYEDFQAGREIDADPFYGWYSGYSSDPWYADEFDGRVWAFPLTDDNGGEWGSGGSRDNYLRATPPVTVGRYDMEYTIDAWSNDDDTLGILLGFQPTGPEFYLYVLCGAASGTSCPLTDDGVASGQSAIVHINGSTVDVLDVANGSYPTNREFSLRFGLNDGHLTAQLEGSSTLLEADIDATYAFNGIGMYAYDMGLGRDGGETTVLFTRPVLSYYDDDDDGVADDDDNCEFEANADQADEDRDGLGNVCDPDYGGGDTDTDTDADTDTDSDTDTDTDTDSDTDTDTDTDTDSDTDTGGGDNGGDNGGGADTGAMKDLTVPGGCACATTSTPGSELALVGLLGLAALARRRR